MACIQTALLESNMYASKQVTLGIFALCLTGAGGCQHERREVQILAKRQNTPITPLTPEEAILVDSVSATSLDEWSYYYTRTKIPKSHQTIPNLGGYDPPGPIWA